jgi:uncharacterized protein
MTLHAPVVRLTVIVSESSQWHRRPAYAEIVHRAHAAGLAGASVFRGMEGYGRSSQIHTTRILSLSEDLPVAIVIVDEEQRVRDFVPQLDELLTDGLAMLDPVEVVSHGGPEDDS